MDLNPYKKLPKRENSSTGSSSFNTSTSSFNKFDRIKLEVRGEQGTVDIEGYERKLLGLDMLAYQEKFNGETPGGVVSKGQLALQRAKELVC